MLVLSGRGINATFFQGYILFARAIIRCNQQAVCDEGGEDDNNFPESNLFPSISWESRMEFVDMINENSNKHSFVSSSTP